MAFRLKLNPEQLRSTQRPKLDKSGAPVMGAKVSTKAAALYVGIDHTTLPEWVREGKGPQSIQNPGKPGTTAQNRHVGFSLESLDTFLTNRSGDVLTAASVPTRVMRSRKGRTSTAASATRSGTA